MQDRFKFRAWNKLSNEMKDVISLNINYEFPDCSNVILETNTFDNIKTHNNPITCANGFNNVVLMQCTGLKGKNGKLIYEGDIVNQIYEDETIYKCEVVYNNCSFQLKHIEDKNKNYINTPMYCYAINYLGHYTEKRLEVIGNIYENPELLED